MAASNSTKCLSLSNDGARGVNWAFRAGDEGSAEVWRVAELPDGTRYLWRPNPEDEDDPETQFWVEGALESGAPYWYDNADPEKISLTDPFEAGWEGPED